MSRWPLTARGTGAALLAVACFIGAHAFRITELLYIGALLALVLAACLVSLHLSRRPAALTRSFSPEVGVVGGEFDVRLRLQLRTSLSNASGRWRDALPDGVDGIAEGAFPQVSTGERLGGRSVEVGYTARALRRGIHRIGPLSITTTDPFGFARRRHTIGASMPLPVTPAVIDLGPLVEQPGDAGGSMHSATDQLGQGADNLIPRHYVPGDSMRRIHWRASAHRDELMVRQEEQETTPAAVVVLDRGAAQWDAEALRAPGADPGFEAAVSACVSVTARLVKEGYAVAVLDGDGSPLAEPIDGGDAAGVEHLAIDLATVTSRREMGLDALAKRFAGMMTGPIVLVTGAVTESDVALLAPLAHHSTLPILLAVAARDDALEHALAAGWRAAQIPPDADLALAWSTVTDRGARRVGI